MSLFTTKAPTLIDVDCNLFHKDLSSLLLVDDDHENPLAILREDAIQETNIRAMLSPSSTLQEAERGLAWLQSHTDASLTIKTTVGIHPYHVHDDDMEGRSLDSMMQNMKVLLQQHADQCAAVGECGLDTTDGFPPLQDQLPWFQAQILLAQELQRPLFVHERGAFEECFDMLSDVNVPVIIHCFTGTVEECRSYVERGYYLSISGYIFKPEALQVIQCLRDNILPLERLMIETDAPYMGFAGCRSAYLEKNEDCFANLNSKKRKKMKQSIYPNVPSSLSQVLDQCLHYINEGRQGRGEVVLSRAALAHTTSNNANQFFDFHLDL